MVHPLPIDAVLPELLGTLKRECRAVLEAPPGAGKTTRVPLAILEAGIVEGRILVLEPRRVAARSAAERMASMLGEPLGMRVGYRIRGDARVSDQTRIEVVTEGILTRILNQDPGLEGIGLVIFDEFHERSIHSDLGLALCLEVAGALREDLRLLVMSATLDGGAVAALMEAAVIRSEGRTFPVEIRHAGRPLPPNTPVEASLSDTVLSALEETEGGVLAFLPGEPEIHRAMARLTGRIPKGAVLRPLYGALPFAEQRAAIAPEPGSRKIVLATAIAETSLTIEDVRVVVDAGLARRSRFDPGIGMARLVTETASRAEIEQRRGRAGRVAPGVCYRLWTKAEEGRRPSYAPPEITVGDLAGLALDLARWGARTPGDVPFLTQPGEGPFAAARRLLMDLGSLDGNGAITAHGQRLARLPLHPRLAHMLTEAGSDAAGLAALLSDRDPMRGVGADLTPRLAALRHGDPRANRGALARIRAETGRLGRHAGPNTGLSTAQAVALAYPDRIGLRRPGDDPRYVLSGGSGGWLDPEDTLAGQRMIVAIETDGDRRQARIRQAVAISEAELREVHGARIAWREVCDWSRREGRVLARRQERFGALVLDDRIWRDAPIEALSRAMLDGVRELGLVWSRSAARFRARVTLARKEDPSFPDVSDAALIAALEDWLLPHLGGILSAEAWRGFDLLPALNAMLDWKQQRQLDAMAPAHFTTPLGRKIPIDYGADVPTIEVRLQELFGVTAHPMTSGMALRVALLSPAGRPVQVTTDLPGFWATSYGDVRKDMRGRYPKHSWPEDPTTASPTVRPRRRGG
ncbi:MAG: ATP-dependent helicase HrpB [Pseudomonadota bacterium]